MHELSLAMEICRIAESHVEPGQARRIVEVGVEVGDDAGVEADNLAFCLEVLLGQPPFAGARARLNRQVGDVLRVSYLEVEDGRADD
ncbi:MAG: hydrogenase maturation nickel metallochaperone HypA [Gemmatimonadota bacterium]|nr:hydrogenase maturation nickel metallochaperone HypA [Gemmatimonadota bacterium]